MSKKHFHKKEERAVEQENKVENPTSEQVETNQSTTKVETQKEAETEPKVEQVSAEELIAKAQNEVNEYKLMAQRIQAEFENYRKRNNDAIKVARADGNNEVLLGILPVVDTVERAMGMIADEKSKEGIGLVLKQLNGFLDKYGIKEIEALGEEFNPDKHNAVMQVEDEANAGKVVEVLQKGYARDGKIVRYAMVKVAK